MSGDWVERPSFAVVRGYDRTEVDDYLAEHASRENAARSRIQELEATVSKFEHSRTSVTVCSTTSFLSGASWTLSRRES